MRALGAVVALVVLLLLGVGCGGEEARKPGKAESPKLEAWEVPGGTEPALLSNSVLALVVDGSGTLWVGTFGGGVSRYDPKSGVWSTFTTKDGLAQNYVMALAVDGSGALWVGTGSGGVSRYDPKSGAWSTFTTNNGLADNDIRALAVDGSGTLWVGTSGGGVSRYDPKNGAWSTFTTNDGLADNDVQALAVDGSGVLWVGTESGGVSRYDPKSGAWSTFTTNDGLADNDVQALAVDGSGVLWVGTYHGGASRHDPKSGAWSTFTTNDGLANNNVWALAVDRSGTLWVGTGGRGVSRYDPKSGVWSTFTTEDGLADKDARAVAVDHSGMLWFGTMGGGVSRYDPTSGAWSTFTTNDGLANNNVRALAVDRSGTLWVGTGGRGVSRYDPKSGAWSTFTTKDGLAGNQVQALAVDRLGTLWVGTWGAGVSRYDPKSGAWSTFTTKDGLAGNQVQALAVDHSGALWVGTNRSGISRYDPKSGAWSTFTTKDGLADNNAGDLVVDGSEALWVGSFGGGISRYDLKSGTWLTFTTKDGLADNQVQALAVDRSGALWIGSYDGGASRYDPKSGAWSTFTTKDGLADNNVWALAVDRSGALWFGSFGGGVSRYDPKSGAWSTFTTEDGLADNKVRAFAVDGSGALWIGTDSGMSRLSITAPHGQLGILLSSSLPRSRIAVASNSLVLSRPDGISFLGADRLSPPAPTYVFSFPRGADVTCMARGPSGAFWVGTLLSGLTLRKPGKDLQLTMERGLPSMTLTALDPVPDTEGAKVWAGTGSGAVLVKVENDELRIERTLSWDRMPTGPVDALASKSDASVFVAYNAIPPKRILDPELAGRRAKTHVFFASAEGAPVEIPAPDAFAASEIRALEYSPQHGLWAGTSAGLFVAKVDGAGDAGTPSGFQSVTDLAGLQRMSIRRLAIAPDAANSVWMASDGNGDIPAIIFGYHPDNNWLFLLDQHRGVPKADVIDDMAFAEDGDLIVMVGNRLARGRVFVPVAPPPARSPLWPILLAIGLVVLAGTGSSLAVVQRRNLYLRTPLNELALSTIPPTLRALRRYRVLHEAWSRLALPDSRLPLLETLADPAPPGAPQLRALAALLGMANPATADVRALPHGLSLLAASLPSPDPVKGSLISLVALDLTEARKSDPARVRDTLEAALNDAGQRFELPFVLLAHGDVTRDILPADLASLHLDERALKSLLFARSPEQAFAGLLHTRGLIALSPYDTSGAVKDAQMFFGRVADLRELLLASSVQHLLVGPRRVGKTSLLKRLLAELPKRRPDDDPVFLDLLGIADHTRAARALARALKVDMPTPTSDAEPETALVEILRRHYQGSGKRGVVLLDEADGLIEADAQKGFPLLSAMRTLQAEETCSFVLAGYMYLYREAMNQRSPLYNFATVRVLGPLDPEAGRDLAAVPMQRLGVAYADPSLPERIVERTGGYPSFVQLLCDAALKQLEGGDLVIGEAEVSEAEKGPQVASTLGDIFRLNAGKVAQIAVYGLLEREAITAADVAQSLASALERPVSTEELDQALLELRLFGFLVEREGRFTWAIPLLRDTLRASGPEIARARLVEEVRESSS